MSDSQRLERVEDKLDKVGDAISSINITLAKQAVVLEEHVKRSTMLEEQFKPIRKHVDVVHGILKLISLLGICSGLIHMILKALKVY
jgi:hypothetical protein